MFRREWNLTNSRLQMPCQECERLEREHAEAEASFDAARERLQSISGISSRDEYQCLHQEALALREYLDSARTALHRHTQKHMGETMDQAPIRG